MPLILIILVAVSLFCCAARAYELEGLPGSAWGNATYDADGISGAGTMGYINQGIDWTTLPGGVTLNTFAEYRWRLRTKNNALYNSTGPAIGLELRKSYFKLGIDYFWEHFTETGETSNNREIYFDWYYGWDLKRFLVSSYFIGLPGSTWGHLTYDVTGINGSGTMGYVNQGIDWLKLPGGVTLNTFAEFRWIGREKNTEFYDSSGPAVGVELRKWMFRAGADYYWQRYPGLKLTSDHMQYYITWYYSWDLKKMK